MQGAGAKRVHVGCLFDDSDPKNDPEKDLHLNEDSSVTVTDSQFLEYSATVPYLVYFYICVMPLMGFLRCVAADITTLIKLLVAYMCIL